MQEAMKLVCISAQTAVLIGLDLDSIAPGQKPIIFILDDAVAFARTPLDAGSIENRDMTS